MKILCNIFK